MTTFRLAPWWLLLGACVAPGTNPLTEDADGDGFSGFDDCDDSNTLVNPDAAELCNQADDDCDGVADEDLQPKTWYEDADGDGRGHFDTGVDACGPVPPHTLEDGTDCFDDDELRWDRPVYADEDGDGFGTDVQVGTLACEQAVVPDQQSELANYDCDDADPAVHGGNDEFPKAAEVCDEIDNDCDARVDAYDDDLTGFRDLDDDSFGDPNNPTPLLNCTSTSGGVVGNDLDCDDGDEFKPANIDLCWTAGLDTCDPNQPRETDACITLDRTEAVLVPGYQRDRGLWLPRINGVVPFGGSSAATVVLGENDSRYNPIGDRPDTIRVLEVDGGFAVQQDITYRLTTGPDLGTTQGLVLDFDQSVGGELAIVDFSFSGYQQAAIWIVSDPPGPSPDPQEVELYDPTILFGGGGPSVGYAIAAGDLFGDEKEELIVTAPSFSQSGELVYLIEGGTIAPGEVNLLIEDFPAIRDPGFYADVFGVDVDYTPDADGASDSAIAVASLGSIPYGAGFWDGPAVLVFRGDDLARGDTDTDDAWLWIQTQGYGPPSFQYGATVAWGDIDPDAEDELAFSVSDGFTTQVYVFPTLTGVSDRPLADDIEDRLRFDMPYADCTQIELMNRELYVSCPNHFDNEGLLLRIPLAPHLSQGPQDLVVTAANSEQVTLPTGEFEYQSLGHAGMDAGRVDGVDTLLLDVFTDGSTGEDGFYFYQP